MLVVIDLLDLGVGFTDATWYLVKCDIGSCRTRYTFFVAEHERIIMDSAILYEFNHASHQCDESADAKMIHEVFENPRVVDWDFAMTEWDRRRDFTAFMYHKYATTTEVGAMNAWLYGLGQRESYTKTESRADEVFDWHGVQKYIHQEVLASKTHRRNVMKLLAAKPHNI